LTKNIYKGTVPDTHQARHITVISLILILIPTYGLVVAILYGSFGNNFRKLWAFYVCFVNAA